MKASWIAVWLACASLSAAAQTTSPYRYTAPQGWTRSVADGMESFAPANEPADTVQIVLMPPKPMQGPLQATFDAERASLESGWGLSAPQSAPPQAGRVGELSYAAHYASYDSAGGPRYMAFMALGQGARLGLLVFVAATPEAFNRHASLAAALLQSLRVAQ